MEIQTIERRVQLFLEKKFRISRSFATRHAYNAVVNKFLEFVRFHYNLDLEQLLRQLKDTKEKDSIAVLDEFYTFLSNAKSVTGKRLSNTTIKQYVIFAKEFLNHEGCHIYNEDLRQRFRLPKKSTVYEKGLTKETINRLIRLANPKLATIILMACCSGMRIGEIVQLRFSDIDFTTNPLTITIRKEITKARQTRVTHITSEATKALQDYLRKYNSVENGGDGRYIFLETIEDKISRTRERLEGSAYKSNQFRVRDKKRLEQMETQLKTLGAEELHAIRVNITTQSLENQLRKIIKDIPELSMKNDNGRNAVHFHAFRAWFKTQVTNAHQSDYAEALMGHSSLKLVYYRQNDEQRSKIYREIEPALTISDTEKIEKSFELMQEENRDLRKIVEGLSTQLKNLEKRMESHL